MTLERRRLLDKHLDTWTQRLQLDDVIVLLLENSVFNEHIIDIIKVFVIKFEFREGSNSWGFFIKYFFLAIVILERINRSHATIPIHSTVEDAWQYGFYDVLSFTIENRSKVC